MNTMDYTRNKNFYMKIFLVISTSLLWSSALTYEDFVDKYQIVEPIHITHRNKRDLSTKLNSKDEHLDETKFQFATSNKLFTLHLHKNRYLLPSTAVKIFQNVDGSEYTEKGIENCYYHGHLGNPENSAVVIETCNGIRGLIQDEDGEEYFIHPHQEYKNASSNFLGKHIFFKSKHMKRQKSRRCGNAHKYNGSNGLHLALDSGDVLPPLKDHLRKRRATADKNYVEVVIVMDKRNFDKRGRDKTATVQRGVDVMNYVDAVYKTMNTRIAVIGVIVWNSFDMIRVVKNAGDTLNEFRKYTEEVLHGRFNMNPDNAQLLSGIDFAGSLVGLAGVGVMCSYTSCAVNMDHNPLPAISANTVAHELGHNLGFYHNGGSCSCPKQPCVMTEYASSTQVQSFSSCVQETYAKRIGTGQMPCLFDYPDKLFGNPKCGNGYLEAGEKCDCGTEEECKAMDADKCCDPKTCTLQPGAKCASGPCCNNECEFESQGTLCRDKYNEECDLPEYCFGNSSLCPKNFYVRDGVSCENGDAVCFQGFCRSHTSQCQTLWGPNGVKADSICFTQNSKPSNVWGNCGKNDRGEHVQCDKKDILCGKLQCKSKSASEPMANLPIIGHKRSRKNVDFYIGDKVISCAMGITSLGGDLDDPTIALDGTKCGENFLCMDHKCKNISKLKHIKSCPKPCQNGGVCNNNGNCHCSPGFACPFCELAGPGGSSDSGQGCINHGGCGKGSGTEGCLTPLVKAMLILFLLVLPLLCLIAYLAYRYRVQIRERWSKYRSSKKDTPSSRSVTEVERLEQNKSRDTGVRGAPYDNPYITQNQSSMSTPPSLRKPPPPPPKHSPSSMRPAYALKKEYSPVRNPNVQIIDGSRQLPPIAGHSPRPARLPPISKSR